MSSRPFGGLCTNRGIGIGKQLLYQRIRHVHAREQPSTAEPARPARALAQLSSAIEQQDFARDKEQSLLPRSGQIAGRFKEGGDLRISIGGRYGLDEAQRAYRDLEGRRTTGKLLIVP
jgi:NADPH:quinone reductase-like Zn-dependent oxidoreductase